MPDSSRHILESFSLGPKHFSDNTRNLPDYIFLASPQIPHIKELHQSQTLSTGYSATPVAEVTYPSYFYGH